MADSSLHFSNKAEYLRRLIAGFYPFSDRQHNHHQGDGVEEDWVCIERLDYELSSSGEMESSSDGEVSEYDDSSCIPFPCHQLPVLEVEYTILSQAEVLRRLEGKIVRVSTVLSLSRSDATTVLHHFKWDVMRAEDEWWTCDEKVRKAVGLFEKPVVVAPAVVEKTCGICSQNIPDVMVLQVSCGHWFCRSCWTGYISNAIQNGPRCLALRCPIPSCNAAVVRDLIQLLRSEEDKKKFGHNIVGSFLAGIKEAKWCPAPGCDYVVFLNAGGDDSIITCFCSYRFCWNCTKEAHAPVDCVTVEKWMSENSIQSENWQVANMMPSPKNRRQIPQNQSETPSEFGLYYDESCCNTGASWSAQRVQWDFNFELDESSEPTEYQEEIKCEREIAQLSLERYNHFYEGWITCESSQANALLDLKELQDVRLDLLSGIFGLSVKELNFLVDGQLQIGECYQLLKWTYVYGYFMPQDQSNKKCLLEFMQEQVKDLVGLLTKQVEELEIFLWVDFHQKQFVDFRKKLLTLTRVTKNYCDKMVDALKTGLPEVISIPRPIARPNKMSLDDSGWQQQSKSQP